MFWQEKLSPKTIHLVFEGKLISTGSSHPKLLRGIIFKILLRVKVALT